MSRRPGSLRVLVGCGALLGAVGLPAGTARAAISFIAANGTGNAAGATTLTVTKPTGVASGDVMVATVGASGTATLSAPAGWTQIADTTTGASLRQISFYRVAGSSEPASYTFSLGASRTASGGIADYRGVNATSPIDSSAGATGAGGNAIVPSVPTTATNEQIVAAGSFAVAESVTPDQSTTLRYGQISNATTTGAADFVQASPGSTPTKTDTQSANAPWVIQAIALRDASTGTLTVSSTSAPTFSVNLNAGDQTPSFTVPMTLTDTRTGAGGAAGWNLSITSTQYATGTAKLATNASAVTAVSATCNSGGSCSSPSSTITPPVGVPAASAPPMPVKFTNAAAGSGMGLFTLTPTIAVSVPQNSFAGAYRVQAEVPFVLDSKRARTALCRLGSLAVMAGLAGTLAPAAAGAAEVPTVGLTAEGPHATKGYFVVHAGPGGSVTESLQVVNPTAATEKVTLSPVTAVTGQTTGAVYLGATDPRRDLATWLRLDTRKLTLGPNQRRLISFTVRVPAGARPGEHLAGIAAQIGRPGASKVARSRGRGTFRVTLKQRTVVAVQLDIPGRIAYKLALTGARAGPQTGFQAVLLGMRNDGNVLTKGNGRLVVTNSAGALVKQLSLAVDTFVPATAIDFPAVIPGQALSAGSYVADVTVTYGRGEQAHGRFPFTISAANLHQTYGSVLPPGVSAHKGGGSNTVVLIAGAVALLAAGFGGSTLLNRRSREQSAPGQPPRITG